MQKPFSATLRLLVAPLFITALLIGGVLGVSGCSALKPKDAAASERPRIKNPSLSGAELASLVSGNTDFALALYRALRGSESGNLFYSPYSISQALAMTYAGARGETEQQMAATLRFLLSQQALHGAFNGLDQELASRGQGAAGKDGKGFRLNIVNAIWGQHDYNWLPSFLDTLAENYGAGIRLVDYKKDPEKCRVTINDWVARQTEQRIKDLIAKGLVDQSTRMVLTNAIYFNAAWRVPFDKNATAPGAWTALDGSKTTVPMMSLTEDFGYAAGSGYQVIELPYDGEELSMAILLPDAGRFAEFEDRLDAALLAQLLEQAGVERLSLKMPKFKFETELTLTSTLMEMGMPVAFSGAADFSGMTGSRGLAISDVVHKAFVAVDEAGTEAAAATAVIMRETAIIDEPRLVAVDRPFVFLIRDVETGAVLFLGRVMTPAQQ
jgi:serpin B